jgi:outer membrane protein OmpA-like peptidoglycan-associated protein
MNITNRRVLAALLAIASVGAAAQEAPAPASAPFRGGWYVAPMATYMSPDSERCNVDSDYGVTGVLGHRGESASIEMWAQYMTLPHGGCAYTVPDSGNPPDNPDGDVDDNPDAASDPAGEVKLNGGGLTMLVGPFSEHALLSRLYGIVGIGVLQRKDHPHYRNDHSSIIGDVGAGYLHPFRLWERDLLLRVEARYRYDVQPPPEPQDGDPPPTHTYNDVIVNLGLQVPLSKPEQAAPAAEPGGVVPAAAGDSDNDGVNDDRDQCPETPANSYVNNVGCPASPTASAAEPVLDSGPVLETAKAGDTIVLKGVTFESGKAVLRADSETILDGVAETMVKRPELRVEIGGHTDDRGAEAYNQDLSQRRADTVMAYLVAHGVDAGRLSAAGYGEAQPVETNDTAEGRERNRRVELKVLDEPQQTQQPSTGEGS